jgi:hypothetical protein
MDETWRLQMSRRANDQSDRAVSPGLERHINFVTPKLASKGELKLVFVFQFIQGVIPTV